ncbi:MAG: hypothetical protein K6E85_16960 [Lachnospiraceae bacterium]|nr:hypothetical protein [Lachnospiraceae bacterium]
MNKRNIDANIEAACRAIKEVSGDTIDKSLRSKMSAFGAAVNMSGVRPAIAYFVKNEESIIDMLCKMYSDENEKQIDSKELMEKDKEELLDKAVSLKLAMNLFIKPGQDEKNNTELNQRG